MTTYVRFGRPPARGHSTNVLALKRPQGGRLAGVSAYEGELNEEGDTFVIDDSCLNERTGLPDLVGMGATDRPAFLLEGEEAGRGPGGEPLVVVEGVRPVPKDVNITCTGDYARESLRLWSRGPRDASGERRLDYRLGNEESPYLPAGPLVRGPIFNPHAPRKNKPDKNKQRRQKQARKKQRAAKRKG